MQCNDDAIAAQVLQRFERYVRIETTSDRHVSTIPSTEGQWILLRMLEGELREIGLAEVELSENGYLIARIPATDTCRDAPTIGFLSHVDTASDVTGAGVRPQIHKRYDGKRIELHDGIVLDPAEYPLLNRYVGQTIVTSDGKTLLGADDKAGVAEMMTFAWYLSTNTELEHGEIELIFTPDEETGHGMDSFPAERVKSVACYTLDGDEEGSIEAECFNAQKVDVRFRGVSIHTGTARGKLVNAVSMLGTFLSMLPRSESPEATDGRFGFFVPIEAKGGIEEAECTLLLRDFELEGLERRINTIRKIALAVEAVYPGGSAEVSDEKQYRNMHDFLVRDPRIMDFLEEAVRMSGVEPIRKIIRGGTDGSRLSELGIPTPNIFTGGQNYHSKSEWAALPAMVLSVKCLLNLAGLWAQG